MKKNKCHEFIHFYAISASVDEGSDSEDNPETKKLQ
jgi:hypothetical protein